MNLECRRSMAMHALACTNPVEKVRQVEQLAQAHDRPLNTECVFEARPGRPEKPELVHPRRVPTRGLGDVTGRGMLLHALAHIEFNAINLALDLVVRFNGMPEAFYLDWLKVAQEEALHHTLLCQRLHAYGLSYGDYPAHDGLWQTAEKTKHRLLARLALVPRLLEARGLDVTPGIRQKLCQFGDHESAEVLDIILRDEIGHVAIGNRWFNVVCEQEKLDPILAFEHCLQDHGMPAPRSPFNMSARVEAGFSAQEIEWLMNLQSQQAS